MKRRFLFTASLLILLASLPAGAADKKTAPAPAAPLKVAEIRTVAPGFAGRFLSSHFAQSQYDWKTANKYLDEILSTDSANNDLVKRSMILAMGAGDLDLAAKRAQILAGAKSADGLAILILALEDFAQDKAADAQTELARMPAGDITDFVRPLLQGWSLAAQGKYDVSGLNETTIHSYNGGLLALHKGDKGEVENFARKILQTGTVTPFDAERSADLFAASGHTADALKIYDKIVREEGGSRALARKIDAIKNGKDLAAVIPALQVKTPRDGAAIAIFDLARILFQEQSDATARLFANMALALDPGMPEARLLLANALARNGRYDEAIGYFKAISPDDPAYLDTEHYVADLLQDAGHTDQAIELLGRLFADHNDVEALIRMGDIYRTGQDYGDALKAYNRAAQSIGDNIPAEYWYLLYARGMTYERGGDWQKAESDLKAALAYKPDHPYLMNYLAYGWADQGVNLDESLKLIQRAAALRPADGYITDSLGWVLYTMGRYPEAAAQLEKAVELLPYDSTLNDHLGDAYWQTGRKLEARFQWQRALGNATAAQKIALQDKIDNGLRAPAVKEARSEAPAAAQ